MSDNLEGYADAISGHAKQNRRCGEYREWRDYENGYAMGGDDALMMQAQQGL